MALTLQSPGVQIQEVDLSLRAPGIPPTTVLIPGFAPKGPTSEPITVSTISEFEQIFGAPTNAAERYFYHTAAAVFNSPANVIAYRLPYGVGAGIDTSSQYSALVYPVISVGSSTGPYSALSAQYLAAYPVPVNSLSGLAANASTTITVPVTSTNTAVTTGALFFGTPTHIRLTQQQYLAIQQGSAFTWASGNDTGVVAGLSASGVPITSYNINNGSLSALGGAGIIILNASQNAINNRYEGNYIGLIDNTNLYPSTPFNDINNVYSVNNYSTTITPSNYVTVPSQRLNFPLSAATVGTNGSLSQVMEALPSFDIANTSFSDTVALGVFKLRQSVFSPNTIALDYVLSESYVGSLDYFRQINNQRGGSPLSFYLGSLDNTSTNIQLIVNPYISQQYSAGWLNAVGVPNKSVRLLSTPRNTPLASDTLSAYGTNSPLSGTVYTDGFYTRTGCTSAQYTGLINAIGSTDALFPVGDYAAYDLSVKTIGNVPSKVSTMLQYVEDPAIWPLSIVTEAGLGTIYANSFNPATSGYFDDTVPYAGSDVNNLTAQNPATPAPIVTNYNAVAQNFINFAVNVRKDHLFIADPLTNIFVTGQAPGVKTLSNPNNNFALNVYWPLRNQFASFNNSYTAVYANVVQVFDNAANQPVWCPFSGFAAQAMANTDGNFQPWFAPAGFTRGILTGVLDIGFSPKQKERDQLYTISLNPVAQFPNEGYVIYGQKTMLKQPSAFDRINVRRLFLTLEVQTNAVAQFFVFEPNTLFTRNRLVNTITPIFDYAKNTQGLYDYLIVCDERNNTPSVIDQNELIVDIYLKPVRTAEFILVNFYATQTSANFSEIVA